MGVTFDLRLIDHRHVVENGIPAVNEAVAANDPSVLADYILAIPFTPDPEAIAYRQARCDQLRKINAPDVIIQNEERMLGLVNGDAYSREELSTKSLDELRELLGTWGWAQNSLSIDKAWYELDWFLQPGDGPDELLMYPTRPKTGDAEQSPLDHALKGCQQSPLDNSGAPIIRPCGSKDEDCFGYNPADKIASINEALSAIDDQAWDDLVPQRIDQYNRASPDFGDAVADIVAQELEYARIGLAVMRKAYNAAQDCGFGVACEYSL